jgi:chorismate mutase
MKHKPFIWFRVSTSIDLKKLKELHNSAGGNFGLALTHLGIYRNSQHLQEINSELKIPLAFYLPDKFFLNETIPAVIQKKMISLETVGLRYLEFNEKYTPCYKVHISRKHEGNLSKLLSDMSEYFTVRALYPSRETVLDFNPQVERNFPEYFRFMVKLGVETLMISYNKGNLRTVQAYFSDRTSGINTDPITDPKIFEVWRTQVDELDNQLIETISKRLEIVKEMGVYKSQHDLPLFETGRWLEILQSRKKIAKSFDIDEELIGKIFEAIHLLGLKKMLEEDR